MQFFQKFTPWGSCFSYPTVHLGVLGAGLHPDGPGCLETPWNGHYNHPEQSWTIHFNAIFPKIHSMGKSLLLPYTLVSLVLDFTQMALVVQKNLEVAILVILNNPEQPFLMPFFQKFTLWSSPCSCPTPWCLCCWTSPRWSWLCRNTLKWPL